MDVARCYVKKNSHRPDFHFKVVLVGDSFCGKTSIIFSYIDRWIEINDISTVGKIECGVKFRAGDQLVKIFWHEL